MNKLAKTIIVLASLFVYYQGENEPAPLKMCVSGPVFCSLPKTKQQLSTNLVLDVICIVKPAVHLNEVT